MKMRKFSDKNSLLYWFPKIRNLGIPLPRTEIIPFSEEEALRWLDGDSTPIERIRDRLFESARKLGFPLFLRTDYFSSKHSYITTCFVESEEKLLRNLVNLIDNSFSVGIFGLPIKAIVLREFIELDWKFKAFLKLPIAPERRYFIKNGKVLCHHPYWPEDAIRFYPHFHDDPYYAPDNWRELLAEMNKETPEEIKLLTDYAERVAKTMDGFWSIDFAKARNGKWYLIDMAVGEESWHPKGCKYAKLSKK